MLTLGGSEAGVYVAPLRVFNAVLGSLLVAWWLLLVRRSADRTDALATGGLLAFLIACVASGYPRQSFDAATAALVWAAAFGVARRVLAGDRQRMICLGVLAIVGVGFGVLFTLAWGAIWLDWMRLSGSAPPFNLTLPPLIYRHYYFVAMLLAALAPAVAWGAHRLAGRWAALIGGGWLLALAAMTGARTVWLGILVAVLAALITARPSRRTWVVSAGVLAVLATAAIAAGLATGVVDRALAGSTVGFRIDMWRETLSLAANDPLTGVGPGAWGIGITQTPFTDTYLHNGRHPDNALVQLIGEAGLLGLVTAALLASAVVVGRRIDLVGARVALIGLVLLAAFTLTNNPTDAPILVVVIVAYAALLAPHHAGSSVRHRERRPSNVAFAVATGTAAMVVALAVLATSAASLRHYEAAAAAGDGDWDAARRELAIAVALDPAMALYHREYGTVLSATGAPAAALVSLERAVRLNPADTAAWRALAMTYSETGHPSRAAEAGAIAVGLRPLAGENALALALVSSGADSERAVIQALSVMPWLSGSEGWVAPLPTGEQLAHVQDLANRQLDSEPTPRAVFAAVWLRASAGESSPDWATTAGLRAVDAILACDFQLARSELDVIGTAWTDETSGVMARLMLAAATDDEDLGRLVRLARFRAPLVVRPEGDSAPLPFSLAADPVTDAQLYRRPSLGSLTPGLAIPREADSLAAWIADPSATAARGAPSSSLATCGGG